MTKSSNRRIAGGWWTAPFIFANELCEKLASGALHANLISYLTQVMHMRLVPAANVVTNFNGTSSLTPLVGAFFADAYLGRYLTIVIFSSVYILGITALVIATAVPALVPTQCTSNGQPMVCSRNAASSGQLAFLYMALALMALGSGGIRPCVSPFGADQFDLTDEKHQKQMRGFFNWFYFFIAIAFLLAVTVVVYVQEEIGWTWGFGIPAIAMALAISFFLSGSHLYRKTVPNGSPITRLLRVSVAAFRNRKLPLPVSPDLLFHASPGQATDSFGFGKMQHSHTDQLRFLDKAAIKQAEPASPWKMCPVSHVEELKCMTRMMPVWLATIMFHTSTAQQQTFSVQQARVMNRVVGHGFEIPPGSFGAISLVTILVVIPIYDSLLLPALRRLTGSNRVLPPLQRMGIGLVVAILSMLVAGAVEARRRQPRQPGVQMSAFWLVPQYALLGLAEAFILIGQLEFSYTQSPESLRSTASALHWITIAAGSYLSSILVSVVNAVTDWLNDNLNKARLHYFYWLLAALNAANMVLYIACARWYRYVDVIPCATPLVECDNTDTTAQDPSNK